MSNNGFTKKFGIDNLIKNVTVVDAICFLIENSIDAAEKAMILNPSKEYHIDLELSSEKLVIKDNCLGIKVKDAEKYLLKIQKKQKFNDKYGEGLKKAIFVLGNEIKIESFNENKLKLDLKIMKENDDDLWKPTFTKGECNDNYKGFSIEIGDLTKDFQMYLLRNQYDEIITRIKIKYRYIIYYSNIKISFNGEILEPKFINADKVYEEEAIINNDEIKVILYNNIKNKDDNGIDFIINNRVIIEKEKSSKISWNKRIIARKHSYTKFFGEVIINSNNIKDLGVSPSHNSINLNSKRFFTILDFMNCVIENNRDYYRKSFITVQLEIDENDLNEWKGKLEREGDSFKYAKDVIEKLYKIGVNNIG